MIRNIQDLTFIQHKLEWKTLRFTRVVDKDFNCGTWLKQILEQIRFNDLMMIHVGFSFIAENNLERIYLFCPKALASYHIKCLNKEDAELFATDLEKKTLADHLANTFVTTSETGNPFQQSGYNPANLVCNYIWITK